MHLKSDYIIYTEKELMMSISSHETPNDPLYNNNVITIILY